MMKFIKNIKVQPAFVLLYNLGLMLVVYNLCRIVFFFVNKSYFPDVTFQHFLTLTKGGFLFDISAIFYTNLLYILMQTLPFRFRLNVVYQKVAKWIFVITNSIAVICNCCDMVYFPYTNRRTTSSVFTEFQNEGNLGKVIFESVCDHWYVVLFGLLLILAVYCLHISPRKTENANSEFSKIAATLKYYTAHSVLMIVIAGIVFIGMRGGIPDSERGRAISPGYANKYANKSIEAAIVLNTPFCIIRTISKKAYTNPKYFNNPDELAEIYSPAHRPQPAAAFKPLNVVVIIVESFGKEYSGFFNQNLENGTYKGYTPFMDSLYTQGLTFEYSYTNGRKSIDAMPSVLSSLPMFIEHFVLSPYSTNKISSLADVLKDKGYYSAFFHGAPNSSMGFQAYAKSAGFDDYFGQDEYGNRDLDGTWAVWDEEFLQYFADNMGNFRQPFVASVFTATSHHPFKIPEKYQEKFPEGTHPIHKCISYTDYALRQFFKKMEKYDWYENTVFVLTADHTSRTTHDEYITDINRYAVPILFYQPKSDLKGFLQNYPVQQMDIMPSLLSYLNYDKPYFAFGQDIFSTAAEDKFAANYNNGLYQIIKNNLFLQFDGKTTSAIYDYKTDIFLGTNLLGKVDATQQQEMETTLKAVIQQYVEAMVENKLR